MDVAGVRAELENDQAWREEEIRRLQNVVAGLRSQDEQEKFRRPLVLILYAHLEGFCKFALNLYVNEVNKTRVSCKDANFAIAAAALSDLFHALRDPQRKCEEFRRDLPDDTQLHRFARDREFVERTTDFGNRNVQIPDSIVDTESNLSPITLRKNLFRLGLKHNQFEDQEPQIQRLLNIRNNIGHGSMKEGVSADLYREIRDDSFAVMNAISVEITAALKNEMFLRANESLQLFEIDKIGEADVTV